MKKKNKADYLMLLISFFIAITLWNVAMGEKNLDINIQKNNIPVQIVAGEPFNSTGLEIIEGQDQKVSVTLRGAFNKLYGGYQGNVTATVDVKDITEPGSYDIPVVVTTGDESVRVERKSVDTINVTVDYVESQEVPVKITTTGNVAADRVLEKITSDPAKVEVTGPRQELNNLSYCLAEVNIASLKDTTQLTVPLVLYNNNGEIVNSPNLTMAQTEVQITVPMLSIKTVPIKVVTTGEMPEGKELVGTPLVSPVNLTIAATDEVLAKTEYIETQPLELSNLYNSGDIQLGLKIPDGVTNVSKAETCTVTVEVQEYSTRAITTTQVRAINANEQNAIVLEEKEFSLVLSGPPSVLETIEPDDVVGVVDLKNKHYDAGTYDVTPVFTVKGHPEVEVLGQPTIRMEVVK